MVYAAQVFDMPKAKAYELLLLFLFEVAPGQNVIRIESAPCHIAGADKVWLLWKRNWVSKWKPSLMANSLEFAECVGQCRHTVITINSQPYGDVTADKVAAILAEYK